MFSNHYGRESEISNKRKFGKIKTHVELNSTPPNNQYVKIEPTREIRKHFEINKNEIKSHQLKTHGINLKLTAVVPLLKGRKISNQ